MNLTIPATLSVNLDDLDKSLYLRYGNRPCGAYLMINDGEALTATHEATIASLLSTDYASAINRIADALSSEYNPIENYNLREAESVSGETSETTKYGSTSAQTETSHVDDKVTETESYNNIKDKMVRNGAEQDVTREAISQTKTTATTHTETVKGVIVSKVDHAHTGTTKNDNNVYAFNSTAGVPDNEGTITHGDTVSDTNVADDTGQSTTYTDSVAESYGGTPNEKQVTRNFQDWEETRERTGSRTLERETAGSVITDKTEGSHTDEESGTSDTQRELTRSGNIGVTTTQDMIQSEINLRYAVRLGEIIVNLVGERLTLSTY